MDKDQGDINRVSLRNAGEPDPTVLERQRLGGVSQLSSEREPKTIGQDENGNLKSTVQTEIPAPRQQKSDPEEHVYGKKEEEVSNEEDESEEGEEEAEEEMEEEVEEEEEEEVEDEEEEMEENEDEGEEMEVIQNTADDEEKKKEADEEKLNIKGSTRKESEQVLLKALEEPVAVTCQKYKIEQEEKVERKNKEDDVKEKIEAEEVKEKSKEDTKRESEPVLLKDSQKPATVSCQENKMEADGQESEEKKEKENKADDTEKRKESAGEKDKVNSNTKNKSELKTLNETQESAKTSYRQNKMDEDDGQIEKMEVMKNDAADEQKKMIFNDNKEKTKRNTECQKALQESEKVSCQNLEAVKESDNIISPASIDVQHRDKEFLQVESPKEDNVIESVSLTPIQAEQAELDEQTPSKTHAKEIESNVETPQTTPRELMDEIHSATTNADADKVEHPEKPTVPPQTYLWEEVKKSKEQGGYPWTHLYKDPLGSDDEPEVIVRYTHSPVNRRRKVEEQLIDGNSREEKKAKTEIGYEASEPIETGHPTQEISITPDVAASVTAEATNEEPHSPRRSRTRATSHEPHSLKDEVKAQAKQFLDEHPSIRSFSNSLTRKGRRTRAFVSRSLERAKSMADRQLDKAKVQMNTLRRRKAASEPPRDLPDHKILMLRESPRFGNREIPAYVVRQPSDEAMDTSEAETIEKISPERTTVVPDEIIELPQQPSPGPTEPPTLEKMEVEEERYEIIEPPKDKTARAIVTEIKPTTPEPAKEIVSEEVKPQPPPKAPRKKKEHHYEDIDDYVPPMEEPKDSKLNADTKLKRQHEIDGFDPIIGEMLGNDKIKISLQLQDEKIVNDMLSRKKRLDEILQHSSEDEKEKDKIPCLGLLAPISSIDSTSSDEDARRTRLSALAEESDTGSIDNAVSKKQESFKEAELAAVDECHKELELTPAEEKKAIEERNNQLAANETATEEKVVEKQLELTPAEEHMLFEADLKAQITPIEEKVLNTEPLVEKDVPSTEDSKPAQDERWSKMRYVEKLIRCFSFNVE